jgi:hypothetical protein
VKNIELSTPPNLNRNMTTYIGQYTNNLASERIYKYRFVLTDETTMEIIEDTNWLIPSQENMSFTIQHELDYFKNYRLTYDILTINNLSLSKEYLIVKTGEIPGYYEGRVLARQDACAIENGYIQI